MRLVALLIFICFPGFLAAQTSVGFTDSTDFQYLINYRLPDWGYSNFFISSSSFDVAGNYRNLNRSLDELEGSYFFDQEDKLRRYSFDLGINPRYQFFRQSEQRTISFTTTLSLNTDIDNRQTESESVVENSEAEQEASYRDRQFSPRLAISGSSQYYIVNDFFIDASLSASANYSFLFNKTTESNNESTTKREHTNRGISFEPFLGIGFGRIRNVTPVLRAIRLNERYRSTGSASFTGSEIITTAEHFTRFNGYQQRYDRPLKYFWEDLNAGVNQKLDALTTYELFYLADVFDENLGGRFAGYEIILRGGYNYNSQLYKTENSGAEDTREFNISRAASSEIEARWFKNLNLEHQLSFTGNAIAHFPFDDENRQYWRLQSSTAFSWLWNFADRWRTVASLSNQFRAREQKEYTFYKDRYLQSRCSGNAYYFIENKLALNAGISFNWVHNYTRVIFESDTLSRDIQNQYYWTINAGVTYYFNRNLF